MIVHLTRPHLRAGARIYRIGVGLAVPEVDGKAAHALCVFVSAHHRRARHACLRLERPVLAARLGIERPNVAGVARDEQPASGNARLRTSRCHVDISEGPLQLQSGQIGGHQSALRFRLITRVRRTITPAIPGWPARGVAHGRVVRAHGDFLSSGRLRRIERLPADVLRHRAPLSNAQCSSLWLHLSIRQRVQDRARGEVPQHLARRRLAFHGPARVRHGGLHNAQMARCAGTLKNGRTGFGGSSGRASTRVTPCGGLRLHRNRRGQKPHEHDDQS